MQRQHRIHSLWGERRRRYSLTRTATSAVQISYPLFFTRTYIPSVSGTGDLIVGAPLADTPRSLIGGAVYLEGGIIPAFLDSVAQGIAAKDVPFDSQQIRAVPFINTTLGTSTYHHRICFMQCLNDVFNYLGLILLSVIPVAFLLFVSIYANKLHRYTMKPDVLEQCDIELTAAASTAGGSSSSAENHFSQPSNRIFRFHPRAHFAIEWILRPLSRERFRLTRNHPFTAAPKDEVENPVSIDQGKDEDGDRVDFAVDENRSSVLTSLQSPISRSWTVSGGRRYTRGIKRTCSSVAVLQEISTPDTPDSLAI